VEALDVMAALYLTAEPMEEVRWGAECPACGFPVANAQWWAYLVNERPFTLREHFACRDCGSRV
jgi:hypothetical protein